MLKNLRAHRFVKWLIVMTSFYTIPLYAKVEPFYKSEQKLIHYYKSGQYMKEFSQVAEQALNTLKKSLASRRPAQHVAIVLDIDETALSNAALIFSAYSLVYQVGDSVPQAFFAPFQQPYHAPALLPVLKLYRYAIAHHVTVFFISARKDDGLTMTQQNLRRVGFNAKSDIVMLKPSNETVSSEKFKERCRAAIEKQGFNIILTMGDQKSDVAGLHTGQTFMLPNPFYYTP